MKMEEAIKQTLDKLAADREKFADTKNKRKASDNQAIHFLGGCNLPKSEFEDCARYYLDLVESNLCINKQTYENQLATELQRGNGIKGTHGYRERGCDKCDGYDQDCGAYRKRRKKVS
jgi:hypothetical protein